MSEGSGPLGRPKITLGVLGSAGGTPWNQELWDAMKIHQTPGQVCHISHIFSHVLVARQNHQVSAYFLYIFLIFFAFPSAHSANTQQHHQPRPTTPRPFISQFHIYFTFFTFPIYFTFFTFISHFEEHPMAGLCPFTFFHILFAFISHSFHMSDFSHSSTHFSHFWGHPKNHTGEAYLFHFFHMYFKFISHFIDMLSHPPPHPLVPARAEPGPGPRQSPSMAGPGLGPRPRPSPSPAKPSPAF